ncbi:MAG TPA: NnrU family protein [Anaerolineales bacterium]|nr:NnrU family protein [Anaerolineales bacterium]
MAKRLFIFLVGVVIYLLFLFTVLYGIGFVGNIFVPKGVDAGASSSVVSALLIDLALLALFGVQHSLMARPEFKNRWTQLVPEPLERSIYVLAASLSLLLLFWQWRPITYHIWNFQNGLMNAALIVLFWIGWIDVVFSTFLINHFDLFGLRQVYLYLRGIDYTPVSFKQPALYNYMRHPLMFAFLVAFWATPQMSIGHLLFAAGMTVIIVVGVAFEERDLLKAFGESYDQYRKQVSMLFPMPRKK